MLVSYFSTSSDQRCCDRLVPYVQVPRDVLDGKKLTSKRG